MDEKSLSYFSSISSMASKILQDELSLKKAVKDQWAELTWKEQEEVIDDYLVDQFVREKYCQIEKPNTYQKSFPKLKVETGEKIVVDFENDCWTWQDEHSSPFNWRTKSQQDLTLDDLEPDMLCKPPSKTRKKENEDDKTEEMAEVEFSVEKAGEIWNLPALQGVQKPELLDRSRSVSPIKSVTTSRESLATSRSKTPEAINYAYSGSIENLSSQNNSVDHERSSSFSSGEVLNTSQGHESECSRGRPARRKRSFSKSPIKSVLSKKTDSDTCSESLVSDKDDNPNAFDNLAMGTKWSSFVNDVDKDDIGSATPSPQKMLLKEPEPVTIDRELESADQPESALLATSLDFRDDFKDEILVVETQPTEDMNASSVSKTGFDFLDNW